MVDEMFVDADLPRLGWLENRARAAGLLLERRNGSRLAYLARDSGPWCDVPDAVNVGGRRPVEL